MNTYIRLYSMVIQKVSAVITREHDVENMLDHVLKVLEDDLKMICGTFSLLHGDAVRIEVSRGISGKEKRTDCSHTGKDIIEQVKKSGQSIIVPDIRKNTPFPNSASAPHCDEPAAFLCIPLRHQESVIGTLSVQCPTDDNEDLNDSTALLEIIAQMTGDAAFAWIKIHGEREYLLEENRKLRNMMQKAPKKIIGNCREMQYVYEQIRQAASKNSVVLIRGEKGTGKDLLARTIMELSDRKHKPFITMNCSSLSENQNQIESELFGHEKGAFTGAMNRRIGRLEAADGGTLFLSEIGALPLQTQEKLLHFLQGHTFSRAGSNAELHSDVRLIAATSKNLEEMMEKKRFRQDLFLKLNIFPIVIPTLAQRSGDIIPLAEHFMEMQNIKYNKKFTHISQEAIQLLTTYSWPGNVRELENCIDQTISAASGTCIFEKNLPVSIRAISESGTFCQTGLSLEELLENYERKILQDAIARNHGNFSAAGRELSVSPRMMNYRIKRLGISKQETSK